jgi:carbonic anhydrase
MRKYSDYEYRKQPGFDMNTFEGASGAIPMKTLVIYCFDPRAFESRRRLPRIWGMKSIPAK